MTYKELLDYEDKLLKSERIRLKNLGYCDSDINCIINEGFERGVVKIILLQILKEVKKK